MRVIDGQEIMDKLATAIITANTQLPPDVMRAIRAAIEIETLPRAKNILQIILENAHIAETEKVALCQDTGMVVIDVEIGQDVNIRGGNLEDILNEGVRRGYKAGYLRNSVVNDPILRINTLDNTPAIIHYKIVSGDKVKLTLFPKGAGSENVGQLSMLNPLDGLEGVKFFVLKTVREAGANPCPPIIVGVGIGGNMEKATLLAKRALLRPLDIRSKLPYLAEFELDLLNEINNLGIGPQGLGGKTTALGVNIEAFATHIASLPVAVNIGCHSTRRIVVEF
ncbi:MAG TPA: fumarate hydratase [Syntrophomonadaceae bacterium]|nr:fumarate hydratase [Syntrophomonadaceae bacterium]